MSDKKMKNLMQPSFLICAAVLLIACIGKEALLAEIIEKISKTPIDLRKSFDEIDTEKLKPYVVEHESKIENQEVVTSLGTENYIQWILVDTDVSENSPVRYCSLFITYYGMPDRVPHVPDECYIGSGYSRIGASHDLLKTGGLENQVEMIEIRRLVFESQKEGGIFAEPNFSRMYFFKVNGDYACTRTGVRKSLGKNLFGKHSFFSKVEWEFFGNVMGSRVRPNNEQNIAASEKLMSRLLPVLENEHWPLWNVIENKEEGTSN